MICQILLAINGTRNMAAETGVIYGAQMTGNMAGVIILEYVIFCNRKRKVFARTSSVVSCTTGMDICGHLQGCCRIYVSIDCRVPQFTQYSIRTCISLRIRDPGMAKYSCEISFIHASNFCIRHIILHACTIIRKPSCIPTPCDGKLQSSLKNDYKSYGLFHGDIRHTKTHPSYIKVLN